MRGWGEGGSGVGGGIVMDTFVQALFWFKLEG